MNAEINSIAMQIKQLETDQKLNHEKIKKNRENIASIQKKMKKLKPNFEEAQKTLNSQKEQAQDLEQQIGSVEEKLFKGQDCT